MMKSDQQALPQPPPEPKAQVSAQSINHIAGILAFLLLIYTVAITWYAWTDEKADSVSSLTTIAELEAHAINSYFKNLEAELKGLGEDLVRKDDKINLDHAYVLVKRFRERHEELFNVTLIRPDGALLLTAKDPPGTTNASLAKEASFVAFLDEIKQGKVLGIGQPLIGVVSKVVIVPVRYAIKDHQGNLRYIVSANLPHEHLRSFWKDAPITARAAIGLMRDNGYLLSRYPVHEGQTLEKVYGQPRTGALINYLQQSGFPERGYVQGPSSLDGPDFLTAFRRLSSYPVTLFIAIPMSDVRAAWWKRISGTHVALFLLLVGGFAAYRYALRSRYKEEMEQQRLGEAQRNSERLFSAIIEASPVPSAANDAHGTITYLNAAFAETFGYSPIDIPTLDEWWPKAYPDPVYRQWVATSWQAKLRNAELSKRAFEPLEVCIRCKDGTDKTVLAASSALGESREGSHLLTLYDITERKTAETALLQSEHHFRSLFNNAQVGVLRSRPDGSAILDCNDKFLEITGRTREEIIGAPSAIFWADPRQRQEMVDGLNADGYWADKDLDLLNKKGEVRHCITSLKLFRENDLLEGSVLDITERKQSEDLLRESELRWKFAIEGSGDGVWDWNIQTDRAAYSSRWKEMLGYSDVDILPTNDEWVTRIHPDDQAYVADAMQAYLDRKTAIYVVEYRLRCKDENYKWILGRGMVVSHSDDGKPLRMIGTHTDITERKQVAEALRESDARYKRAVDGASDGIWEFVMGTGENYMSPHLKQMLGYEDHELPNVLASYVGLLHPDDTARVMEMRKAHIEQRKPYEMEMRLRCKSGAYRWFYSRGQATWDENGQPVLLSGSISDVTARKKVEAALKANEERFRQAFDRSPTGMLLCELDGVIAKANESFCRMSGYASAGIVGRRLADLSPNTSARNDEIALFRRIACREIADFSVQIELLHKNGYSYVVQNFVSVVRSSEDVPLYCIVQVENLTERKQQQLEALGKQVLIMQEKERSRLSRELHDDIGQSLIALKLMLQRIQNNCSRGQDREPLQQAKVAAEQLIADVRSIAYSLRPSQLDDLGLMPSLRWHLDKVARPAGLESVLSGNLGDERLSEALELCCFRVVQEALTNVLKHARASKLEVSLNRGENKVLLTLRDNGIGFDVTRHYLAPGDSRSLGLIGMRERVAAMGSRLEIESSPGQGTKIRASFAVP